MQPIQAEQLLHVQPVRYIRTFVNLENTWHSFQMPSFEKVVTFLSQSNKSRKLIHAVVPINGFTLITWCSTRCLTRNLAYPVLSGTVQPVQVYIGPFVSCTKSCSFKVVEYSSNSGVQCRI